MEAAAGWQAKVLDFGLALTQQRGRAQTPELAGTLAYLAPELLLGKPPSEASDLYALGVIAFEVLSGGRHPLAHVEHEGAGPLASAILSLTVDPSALDAPPALRELVVRLLARDPAARPDSAAALAGELYRAAGLEPPAEQVAVRESYLQAARFVSRERELQRLLDALRDSLRGSGRVICIGGESGVGKSRLLDELRTQALVRGARVLRGQAVRDAGRAFHVLQDVIEPLCLELPPQDAALGVLLPLFPRLAGLLPHAIAEAPPLDAASMQERALTTLERLLLGAASPQRPLVVLLEDVQWAGRESLALLGRLAGLPSRGALLLVCTYRDDERPDLPSAAPGTELLKLHRLDEPAVAALSESMLGASGRSPEVVGFLQRESEGNPFFIVEILRALAEEGGGLQAVGPRQLRDHVLTGGVRAVLERRVSQVPGAWRGLLELAAVLGRQIEPQVLLCSDAAAGLRGRPLDDFLLGCAELSILEVRDQRWRFVHDKLREYVLEGLRAPGTAGAGRREQELHHAALTALERAHAARGPEHEAARDPHRLQLAHHYLEAAPLVPVARALEVALQAAEHALHQLGFAEAATLLERALVVSERGDAGELDDRSRYALLLLLGQAQIRAGNPGRGQEVCERAAGLARRLNEPELLAQAAVVYGSEITLGYTDPKLVQLLEEALAVLPPRDHPLRARALARLAAALQPAPDPQEPVELGLQAVAMARRLGDTEVLRATLTASCSAFVNHLPAPQRRDFNHEVVRLATAARDRVQVLRGHMRLVFDHAELGELDGVEENIRALEAGAHEFRQAQYQWPPRMMRAMTALIAGRFEESDAISREVLALAERHREGNALLSAATHRMCRLHCGELHDELRAHEQTLRRMVSRVFSRHSYLQWAVTAWCQARAGQRDEVQATLERVRGSRELLNNRIFMPYVAEPCLVVRDIELAARLHARLERQEAGRFWQFGLASMAIYPPYAQQLGLTALTLGRTDEAVIHFTTALQRSERTGLLVHLARLRYQLAGTLRRRGLPGDRRRARGLLVQARELALALGQRDLVPLIDAAAR